MQRGLVPCEQQKALYFGSDKLNKHLGSEIRLLSFKREYVENTNHIVYLANDSIQQYKFWLHTCEYNQLCKKLGESCYSAGSKYSLVTAYRCRTYVKVKLIQKLWILSKILSSLFLNIVRSGFFDMSVNFFEFNTPISMKEIRNVYPMIEYGWLWSKW